MSVSNEIFDTFQAMNRNWAQTCMMWGQSYFNLVDSLLKFWKASTNFYTPTTHNQ